jgi:hypothetical protein
MFTVEAEGCKELKVQTRAELRLNRRNCDRPTDKVLRKTLSVGLREGQGYRRPLRFTPSEAASIFPNIGSPR